MTEHLAKQPATQLEIVRTIADLRRRVKSWQRDGLAVGLVPTMGGLHAGHLALAEASLAQTGRTVATLFVNPKQFGPSEDFGEYPRDEARDTALLEEAGVHLLFAPAGGEMYPDGFSASVSVSGLGDILEGAFRPGFFTGVATVVTKLFLQSGADRAFFGEKDYQQLQVVKRLVADLNIPIAIDGVPTVREPDGLALSSRNRYLDAHERRIAPTLYRTLTEAAGKVRTGEGIKAVEAWAAETLAAAGFAKVDYVTVRDAATLAPFDHTGGPGRVLAAAKLGKARLIDNVPV
ncbi:MAG: pantoate--beta-alanine ligase [Rhodospirillales bacterium]